MYDSSHNPLASDIHNIARDPSRLHETQSHARQHNSSDVLMDDSCRKKPARGRQCKFPQHHRILAIPSLWRHQSAISANDKSRIASRFPDRPPMLHREIVCRMGDKCCMHRLWPSLCDNPRILTSVEEHISLGHSPHGSAHKINRWRHVSGERSKPPKTMAALERMGDTAGSSLLERHREEVASAPRARR